MFANCHGIAGGASAALQHGKSAGPSGPFADWLTRAVLAAALGVRSDTLARWESRRTGPPCVRVGRHALYRIDAVREWLVALERRRGP